jgi:signal transduction histidine kinase
MYKEILHNIVKHSGATAVNINFRMEGSFIIVSIRDNGRGIEIDSFENGMGLKNLQKRAVIIGADLEIVGHPLSGTEVTLRLGTNRWVNPGLKSRAINKLRKIIFT